MPSLDLFASRRHRRSSSGSGVPFLCLETAYNEDSPNDVIKPPFSTVVDTSNCENVTEHEPAPEPSKTSRGDLVAAQPGSSSETFLESPDCMEAITANLEPRAGETIDDITICCEDLPYVELKSAHVQYPFKLVHGEVQHSFAVVSFNVPGEACVAY